MGQSRPLRLHDWQPLKFEMGSAPNEQWGVARRPASPLDKLREELDKGGQKE